MEYLVTLHTANDDVCSRFPSHKQAEAIALWQEYVANGKFATLTND